MDYQCISVAIDDGMAVITMSRPEVMNALSTQARAELTHAFRDLGQKAKVIVLTGEGKAFCTGQDLGDGGNVANMDLERGLRDEYLPMLNAIRDCPVPTIAAVNGPAAGAGASLALALDVVIASENAYFLQAFSRIGLIPDAGGTYYLPRQVGLAKAVGAALFADKITARQAEQWGMIWEVTTEDAFEETWKARATHLANGPTVAYRHIVEAMRASFHNDFESQFLLEAQLQGKCGQTRDFREGVVAFLEKRPPHYEGR
ncbi:enoyl-CoA hydratase-related protein [Shimia biformata]|uniref:enoyl-CoA hydratase-related protein n=1 Tax=Shimia biformata TaxID=1294299 RepID=UPI00194DCA2E|nr:enoyl-CoA hydratase-related protein [Shimia biformata]